VKTSTPKPGQRYEQAGRIWAVVAVFRSLVDGRQRVHLKSPQQPDRRILVATLTFAYRPVRCSKVTSAATSRKDATSLTRMSDQRSVQKSS
jgi:hypothetical protein